MSNLSKFNNKFLVTLPNLDLKNKTVDAKSTVEVIREDDKRVNMVGKPDAPYVSNYQELELDKYSGELLPVEQWDAIRRNAVDAIASNERIQAIAQLNIFCGSELTITSTEIKELIDVAPVRTGFKWDTFEFTWCGIIFDKNGQKIKTWKVSKFNPFRERIKKINKT